MNNIRLLTEEDYVKYKPLFERIPELTETSLFYFTYGKSERLVSVTDEKTVLYQLLPNGEYKTTDLYFNEDAHVERMDYFEYSLIMNRVPKFVNNDTNCTDIIYGDETGKLINYSQINNENNSRLLLQYFANEKRSDTFEQMTTIRPELICFQNDAKEGEEQKYSGGGLVFAKTANPDMYVRIYGVKSNGKYKKIPVFSKVYEYKYLKEMMEKGGFSEKLPRHFADLYKTDEISLCFELGMELNNFGKSNKPYMVYTKTKSNI